MFRLKHIDAVGQWHYTFKISTITDISDIAEWVSLRTKLMEEEINEYFDAGEDLIARADALTDMYFIGCGTMQLYIDMPGDVAKLVEGYMKTTFYTHERLLVYLLNLEDNKIIFDALDELFKEVLRSNNSKADENGNPIFREDGKLLKSDLFEEPNLKKVLFYEED